MSDKLLKDYYVVPSIGSDLVYRIKAHFEPSEESIFEIPLLECSFPKKVSSIENTTFGKLGIRRIVNVQVDEDDEYDVYEIMIGRYVLENGSIRTFDARSTMLSKEEINLERRVIILQHMGSLEANKIKLQKRKHVA